MCEIKKFYRTVSSPSSHLSASNELPVTCGNFILCQISLNPHMQLILFSQLQNGLHHRGLVMGVNRLWMKNTNLTVLMTLAIAAIIVWLLNSKAPGENDTKGK